MKFLVRGLIITFVSTLPIGVVNLAADWVYKSNGVESLFFYVCGAMLGELPYMLLALFVLSAVSARLLKFLKLSTSVFLIALGIFLFKNEFTGLKNITGENNTFCLGLGFSILNFYQLLFWFFTFNTLFKGEVALTKCKLMFVAGSMLGTTIGIIAFVFLYRKLIYLLPEADIFITKYFLSAGILLLGFIKLFSSFKKYPSSIKKVRQTE